jgi:hypothetical protein
MPAEPFAAGSLHFRGIPDTLAPLHLEGSECCLIHTDNPLRAKQTYINPQVRVGYNSEAYNAVHPQEILQSPWQIYKALWENRLHRWALSPKLKEWKVRRKVAEWRRKSDVEEIREVCLIDEMQVLTENGWAHV